MANTVSCHDHGNCELCDEIGAEVARLEADLAGAKRAGVMASGKLLEAVTAGEQLARDYDALQAANERLAAALRSFAAVNSGDAKYVAARAALSPDAGKGWLARNERMEKALDFIDLIAQTDDVGERLVVLTELGLITTGEIADVPHPQYGTFGKSEVIRGLIRAALDALEVK